MFVDMWNSNYDMHLSKKKKKKILQYYVHKTWIPLVETVINKNCVLECNLLINMQLSKDIHHLSEKNIFMPPPQFLGSCS